MEGSKCGSGSPKYTDPTDPGPDADPDPHHFVQLEQLKGFSSVFYVCTSYLKSKKTLAAGLNSCCLSQEGKGVVPTRVADPWHFGGSGSGSADPCLWLMDSDPDPSIFIIDLQDTNKKTIKKNSFPAYYFLKVLLHHFSKIKSQKEVTKQ